MEGLIALPTGQRGLVTQTQRRLSISRISIPATIEAAPAASQPLFQAVKKQLGVAPICSGSQPTAQLRSRATSAHTYLGRNVAKLDDAEITANRNGASNDPRADAAVRFVVRVTQPRGHVSNEEFAAVKAAGYTDAQIIEIVQHVALNTWTSYINALLAATDEAASNGSDQRLTVTKLQATGFRALRQLPRFEQARVN